MLLAMINFKKLKIDNVFEHIFSEKQVIMLY
ncbi:hypothetical protein EFS19_06465 [Lactobacillus acidophilus]|nr:hypothetical protein [Lactobacillus acidophilus]